jgi:adenylate cyclase
MKDMASPATDPHRPQELACSEDLLEMYLGRDVARRVLAGEINRGSSETIRAVIWLCDLRGFSVMADTMPRDELVDLLNAFFDCMAEPVHKHGGEVLKFLGDGLLAIFNLSERPKTDACHAAYRAAVAALDNMAESNARREAIGAAPVRFGLALHVGEVMYGNVGAAGRLDFTVIGAAVNEASRMEKMCKDLDLPLLASETFAAGCPGLLHHVGRCDLPGTGHSRQLFTIGPYHERRKVP